MEHFWLSTYSYCGFAEKQNKTGQLGTKEKNGKFGLRQMKLGAGS